MCLFYFKLYNFYTKNSDRKIIWTPNKSRSDLQMFFVYFNKLCGLNKIELSEANISLPLRLDVAIIVILFMIGFLARRCKWKKDRKYMYR